MLYVQTANWSWLDSSRWCVVFPTLCETSHNRSGRSLGVHWLSAGSSHGWESWNVSSSISLSLSISRLFTRLFCLLDESQLSLKLRRVVTVSLCKKIKTESEAKQQQQREMDYNAALETRYCCRSRSDWPAQRAMRQASKKELSRCWEMDFIQFE